LQPFATVMLQQAVHVWTARTSDAEVVDSCRVQLSNEETAGAARFAFERDRRTAVVSRGMRRAILASFLGASGRELRFEAGAHGKPMLLGGGSLRFNVAHSGDVVVLAVTSGREVGVDIEEIRVSRDVARLARLSFSEHEQRALAQLSPDLTTFAFFRS